MSKADSAYRTIAEVSDLLGVQPSVLRFWETQFQQIHPTKRMGRRYYNAEDVVILARIRDLLYKEGFTIKGVQKKLKEGTPPVEAAMAPTTVVHAPSSATETLVHELVSVRDYLKDFI